MTYKMRLLLLVTIVLQAHAVFDRGSEGPTLRLREINDSATGLRHQMTEFTWNTWNDIPPEREEVRRNYFYMSHRLPSYFYVSSRMDGLHDANRRGYRPPSTPASKPLVRKNVVRYGQVAGIRPHYKAGVRGKKVPISKFLDLTAAAPSRYKLKKPLH